MKHLAMLLGVMFVYTSLAQAQTFQDLHDAVPGKYFSAANSTQTETVLTFGLETGFNTTTWLSNAFVASTYSFYSRYVVDALTFLVVAPAGETIAALHYAQSGSVTCSKLCGVVSEGILLVDEIPYSLGASPTVPRNLTISLSGQGKTTVRAAVFIALNAFDVYPYNATMSLDSATLTVDFE